MITVIPSERNDDQGLGHFGAPRGSRTHRGIDLAVAPSSTILCPVDGLVTKLGYPYGDDLSWRYVEVRQDKCTPVMSADVDGTCPDCGLAHYRHRFFYVTPSVVPGSVVTKGMKIGYLQDISIRYPGMTPHVHYEVKLADEYVDPAIVSPVEP